MNSSLPWWQNLLQGFFRSGPRGMSGWLLILACAVSIAFVIAYSKPWRHRWLAILLLMLLAGIGYVLADYTYVSMVARMKNPAAMRRACQEVTVFAQSQQPSECYVRKGDLPPLLQEMGVQFANVESDATVRLSLIPLNGLTGGEMGIIFSPNRVPTSSPKSKTVRGTWCQDFYWYRLMGE